MSQMEGVTYGRPMSAAARAAALRAKMAGAGIKLPNSAAMGRVGIANEPTYLAALDKLTTITEKWLASIEQLKESAQKQQQKRTRPDDPASSDERVHKTPLYKLAARKKAEDVMMKEASRIIDDNSSGKSVGSNERIRPGTPPPLPKIVEPRTVVGKPRTPAPTSHPAPKVDTVPKSVADAVRPNSTPDATNQDPLPTLGLFRPPVTAHTSIASIPPTPPAFATPSLATPGETYGLEQSLAPAPPTIVAPTPLPLLVVPSDSCLKLDTSVKSADALSTSSAKKRRLSSKTILESLMEKKSRSAIWYDGATQKVFHDMVFEMSQQIQSMKREGRIVMFTKDPRCRNLLLNLDTMLQKSLRTVEVSSFLFLKGKADIRQVDTLKTDLEASLKDIAEFKKSGWTMAGADEDEDEDDDSESDEESE
ncbi:hypothetical protein H072_2289 [Dactylellina haptotyla CBS 200.50]|uniref:Uncharacterized protein n=1 Tax=Dactylellina haptotyla (strain CBS 200.50) TaxID=1284197 RepID=S8BW54_DACHA|nr:hypothetical protein H072_2289 [Dactylellina haptotyla CBS 200.50]